MNTPRAIYAHAGIAGHELLQENYSNDTEEKIDNLSKRVCKSSLFHNTIAPETKRLNELGFVIDYADCRFKRIIVWFKSIVRDGVDAIIEIKKDDVALMIFYHYSLDVDSFISSYPQYMTELATHKEKLAAVNLLLPQPIAEEIAPEVCFFDFLQFEFRPPLIKMQARIREYCASRIYLRDFIIREENQNVILEHALEYRRIILRTQGDTTLLESAFALFSSTDLITWRDVDRGSIFTTDEMLHRQIIRDGVHVTEETAKIIANMVSVTPHWISTGRWGNGGSSRAVYNINGGIIVASFSAIAMSRSGAFCKWHEYEKFFVDFNPGPTVDMLIERLVAERDQLRANYPEIAQYGYPLLYISDSASNKPTDRFWGDINAILGAVRIINTVLPQPIAEEIMENYPAEFIAR